MNRLSVGGREHLGLARILQRRAVGGHVGLRSHGTGGLGEEGHGRGRSVGGHVHGAGNVGNGRQSGRAHVGGVAANTAKARGKAGVAAGTILLALHLVLFRGEPVARRAGGERAGDTWGCQAGL